MSQIVIDIDSEKDAIKFTYNQVKDHIEVVGAIAHLIHYTRSATGMEKEDIEDMINFFIELLEKEDEKDRQTTKLAS